MSGARHLLFVTLLLGAAGCGGFERKPIDGGTTNPDAGTERDAGYNGMPSGAIQVRTVLDGDTIIVGANATVRTPDGQAMDGTKIRLIGIDSPEIAHAPDPADCWGDEAHEFTRGLVGGRIVTLDYDPLHCAPPGAVTGCRDDYGRLLAYVIIGEKTLNQELLSTGNARVFRGARFQHRDTTLYNALEAEAKAAGLGMWSCP
ncbi:MAG: thermonuclease family protein [Myxococcales bacterium]|nr:thermonuclease family protein [Myxococcales bacterium]